MFFLRNVHKESLSLEDADKKQSQLVNKLKGTGKGKILFEKGSFLKNVVLFIGAREKILNNFKSKIYPIKI